MGQSTPFAVSVDWFDPETLDKLARAYDLAITNLHAGGQPAAIREIIAGRIMASARRGEQDIHQLCRAALRGIALPF